MVLIDKDELNGPPPLAIIPSSIPSSMPSLTEMWRYYGG
jgi:hypothetical protein